MAFILFRQAPSCLTAAAALGVSVLERPPAIAAEGLRLVPIVEKSDVLAFTARVTPVWVDAAAFGLTGLVGLLAGLALMGWRLRQARRRHDLQLERSALRFAQLAEQSSDVVLRIHGEPMSILPSGSGFLDYSTEDMRSLDLPRLVYPEDRSKVIDAYKSLRKDRRPSGLTFRLLRRNGETIWAEATLFLIEGHDDEPEIVCMIRDITKRRQEADALRLASQAAREAQAAADEANRAKDNFLASMSHEIRTPLNAIIGFADLMLATPDITSAVRRHAERIKGGGDALLTIVNDILDLSQAEAGTIRLDPRPFALPLLVDECLALVEPSALAKDIALRVDLADRFPTGLMGDDGRLRQILLNLLNNAIKFTPQGHVTLRIAYDRTRGPNIVSFEVTDTGIGIAAEQIPYLFQRFRQVDGTIRRTYGGTGLGLAISKTLVERMGGTIGVRSEKDIGSTFWFAIDMLPAPLVLERPVPKDRPTSRPMDILLVEDVPINQELACAILKSQGHRVDVVSDGADAIMAVQHSPYDLVLMDVQMPGVDGLTATRAIRDLGAPCRFVPIVAMTAAVLKEQVAAARAAGMDDVLPKPLSLPALEALLERAGRDAVRAAVDPSAFDASVAASLSGTIGDAKVAAMQALLVKSLAARFTSALSADTVATLKAESHASIAGAAMLGFPRFGARCRAFCESENLEVAATTYLALRRELYHVVRLAENAAGVASRSAA